MPLKSDSAVMGMTRNGSPEADVAGGAAFRNDIVGQGRSTARGGINLDVAAYQAGKKAEAQTAAYVPETPRMIVRNGELSLRVKDVKIAEAQVREVARAARGAVEASEGTGLEGPTPSLSVTLRVPEPKFDDTLMNLENLGARLGKTISSEDVTAQAFDMEARIKSLRVQEDAYRAILGAARKISDVLEVQEKLTEVRTEIEQLVAARRGLGDQAARSKIVVTLSQTQPVPPPAAKPVEPGWFATAWSESTGALRSVVQGLATLGLWLLVMSPVWIPLGLVSLFVYRRTRQAQAA